MSHDAVWSSSSSDDDDNDGDLMVCQRGRKDVNRCKQSMSCGTANSLIIS